MTLFGDHLLLLVAALLIDALVGDPPWLWGRVGHPVAWIGAAIGSLDRVLNRDADPPEMRRAAGVVAMAILLAGSIAAGVLLAVALAAIPFGWIGTIAVAAILLAGRSLFDHVRAVQLALASGSLPAARAAVGRIVGRDTGGLDEAGVSRAAIESCAESFSDGVIAPAFWFAVLGLPGLLAYKVVNTADSMIGHRTPRHESFGWAAARLDDVANFIPARLSGLLIALAAPAARGRIAGSLRTMRTDARRHASPNAGWPEAAMAGALGLALLGPRVYGGEVVASPFINANGRKDANAADIGRGLMVFGTAGTIFAVALVAMSHLVPG